jgi:hypothetical protein
MCRLSDGRPSVRVQRLSFYMLYYPLQCRANGGASLPKVKELETLIEAIVVVAMAEFSVVHYKTV